MAAKDPLAATMMASKYNEMSFANKSITDFQLQLLTTASKKAAEKKKGQEGEGQKWLVINTVIINIYILYYNTSVFSLTSVRII